MPYSKTPQQSTYQTKTIDFLASQYNRGVVPTTDIDFLNVYLELRQDKSLGENDYEWVKRPGSTSYIPSVGTSPRGHYYNADFKKYYYVVADTLYVWNVATNTLSTSIAAFFGTSSGDVGFTEYLYDNGTQVVVLTDGTTLKQIDSANVVTTCVDPDLPVPHQPYPIFLDGYLFVLKTGTGDLYNSDLNNPMQWTAGAFISCEILPDQAIRPIKLNNYIAVFGTNSIEYFWDAGNSTGTPLQRNDTPVKFNGYLGGYAQWGNKVYFVGNNVEGQPSVFSLEDLKMDEVAGATLTRYLANLTQTYSTYRGSIVCTAGHVFYVLNAGSYTFVGDLTTKQWFRWAYQQNSGMALSGAVNIKTADTYRCLFYRDVDSTIYQFSPLVYQDMGVNYTCQLVTENEQFDTYNQKTMSRLTLWADKPTSSATALISWSDDDYQTFSSPVPLELYQERPSINRLGRFRKRAFKLSFTQNQPMRFRGIEVNINMGQN